MRARWEALHQSLAQAVRTLEAAKQFNEARQTRPPLARFEDAVSLLAYLNSKDGDLDEKDAIYEALVKAVRGGDTNRSLALHLVWLGIWPALDAIYRRRIHLFIRKPEELVSEISDCLNEVIAEIDFSLVHRIAATLTRSTERKIIERRREIWDEAASRSELPDDADLGTAELLEPEEAPASLFGIDPNVSDEDEVAALRDWLVAVVGDDADLVIGAAIYGESQKDIAKRLGLTHAAARKRFQRALARVRARLRSRP